MLRKMISLSVVVFAVFFALNALAADEAVQATAPVDGVVAVEAVPASPCGCADSRFVLGKRLLSFRKALRCFEPAQGVEQTEVAVSEPAEAVIPAELVRISAFKKLHHNFAKTHVWVEKSCDCKKQCECSKAADSGCSKTSSVQWVSFPAYKKGILGFRSVEAWKPIPACPNGG
ncbi:MAG: hypothetical protein LBP87_01720 [Planctomycetaceae bacterium]|jgi:hypothetical protein|nr:hypothetical protein [Planctomycetaceae bacterium]